MALKEELTQLSHITEKAITQLKWIERIMGLKLGAIEIALAELQDGVCFLKERLNNAK